MQRPEAPIYAAEPPPENERPYERCPGLRLDNVLQPGWRQQTRWSVTLRAEDTQTPQLAIQPLLIQP
jgi:hypothetical protein